MSRIFITGSADGLGKLAGELLIKEGHSVVLHARHKDRAASVRKAAPKAEAVVVGDLSSIAQTKSIAEQVNTLGDFDAVIHNAAVGYQENKKIKTDDGLPHVFVVNSLAPYILTALINKPKRLIYLSSGLHRSGNINLDDIALDKGRWNGYQAYNDSKLHNVVLAFAAARYWKDVYSNAIEPGWVPTKMGGPNAPDNLEEGTKTQAWLAVSNDENALVSGKYFFHKRIKPHNSKADDKVLQDKFLEICRELSGVEFPK